MNALRLIQSPHRRGRGASATRAAQGGRLLHNECACASAQDRREGLLDLVELDLEQLNHRVASVVAEAMMSLFRRISSAASSGRRSWRPSAVARLDDDVLTLDLAELPQSPPAAPVRR